jgi:hypothetical protein
MFVVLALAGTLAAVSSGLRMEHAAARGGGVIFRQRTLGVAPARAT